MSKEISLTMLVQTDGQTYLIDVHCESECEREREEEREEERETEYEATSLHSTKGPSSHP